MTDRTFWIFFYACAIFTLGGAGVFFLEDPEWGSFVVGIGSGLGITMAYFIVCKIIESYKGEGT